jgi:hypothetical protein
MAYRAGRQIESNRGGGEAEEVRAPLGAATTTGYTGSRAPIGPGAGPKWRTDKARTRGIYLEGESSCAAAAAAGCWLRMG